MNYVFDLDNTLCSTSNSDYINSKPFLDRIEFVNRLYEEGNKIVIYTARGMKSCDNNQMLAINKYFSLTQDQINSWGLKYHHLFLGKPSGDIYVDDKGIESEDFFRTNNS